MKNVLNSGASVIALMLFMPGMAVAAPPQACGIPDTSQNPNVVSCVSDPNNYQNGIVYDQGNYATPAGLKIDVYGTAVVQPTTPVTAISVIGTPGNTAQISLRSGARVTSTGVGMLAQANGAGASLIDSRGTVSAQSSGLLAQANTGTASVTNRSGGSVSITSPGNGTIYGILAAGGSGTATNGSSVLISGTTATGTYNGIGAGATNAGGLASITNTGTVGVNVSGIAVVNGLVVVDNAGSASVSNSGSVDVQSGSGEANGMLVAGGANAGAVLLSNTGSLTVASDSGSATGMNVQQGTSVTLSNTQTLAGTTAFTVTGANVTGFRVANATGAVLLTNSGVAIGLTGAAGQDATAASLAGGTTQTVQFTAAKLGSTVYSGDVTVQAGNDATGINLSGATGAVDVTFNGAALSVTSTNANAGGVTVAGGSTVRVATAIDAANARGAGFSVTGGGNGGAATGIAISGATGAVTTDLADSFSVANTVNGGGSARGIDIQGGTDATITLAKGLSVSGVGASGVNAGDITTQTGNETLTSAGAFTVDGKTGSASGIRLAAGGGASATVNGFSVTGIGASGALLRGGTGAVSFTDNGAFSIQGGTANALGVNAVGGTDQTVLLTKGGTVAGGTATGINLTGASGAVAFTSSDAFSVTATAGAATGIAAGSGTSESIALAKAFSVSATNGPALGISAGSANADVTLNAGDTFTVTSTSGSANGVNVGGSKSVTSTYAMGLAVHSRDSATGQSLDGSGAMVTTANGDWTVTSDTGQAIGGQDFGGTDNTITLNGKTTITGSRFAGGFATAGSGAQAINFNGGLVVTALNGSAAGAVQGGGTSAAITLLQGATVSGTQGGTYGFRQIGGSSSTTFTATGAVSVTTTSGPAIGLIQLGNGAKTITLNDALAVTAAGGETLGIRQSGVGTNSITTNAGFTVSNTGGGAIGVQTSGPGNSTVNIGAGLAVSGGAGSSLGVDMTEGGTKFAMVTGDLTVTADNAVADNIGWGIRQLDGSSQTAGVTGDLTVSANGAAAGAFLEDGTGPASFTAGGLVNVTSVAGPGYGISLRSGTTHTISTADAVTVSAASGEAYGLRSREATGSVAITASGTVTVSDAADVATAIQVLGGADVTVTLNKAVSATSSGTGDAYGVQLDGATGLATIEVPAGVLVKAVANTGRAFGISAIDGAGLTIDPPDITVTAAGDAYGVYSTGQVGAQNVTVGTISATSTAATANGVSLSGAGAITLVDAASITAASATGGSGVTLQQTGASDAISATLNTVSTTGDNTVGVNLAQSNAADTTGTISATIRSVGTAGAGSTGVSFTGSESGAATVTLGTASGATHSGGVTTTGAGADGVQFTVVNGSGTLTNNGTIAVSGAGSEGVLATATGTGAITVNNWNLTTTAGTGIDITGAGGAVAVNSTTVGAVGGNGIGAVNTGAGTVAVNATTTTASGAGASGIVASSASGGITIAAKTTTAAAADAIVATSTSGNVTVNLADGGATASSGAAGLTVSTGGTATINLGSAATTATLSGATAGIRSAAAGGQTVTLSGTIGAGNNAAVLLSGGVATLVNKGTINGYITLSSAGNTVTNTGTWNAFGGDSTFGGISTLTNTGTIAITPAAATATTTRFLSLTTLANSGTVSLGNGHTGDILDIGAAAVSGSGSARLTLDANLGSASVGVSAAQSADQLRTTGASSGATTIVINDLGSAQAGQFNFSGIRVVTNGSSSATAYTLQGGAITKGFVQYVLAQDAGSNWNLVGLPTAAAFEVVRTAAQVQKFWRRSGDAWAEQMRTTDLKHGSSLWMQVYGGGQTDKSAPSYTQTVLGKATVFNPNLDIRNSWAGVQFGYRLGRDTWGVGLTGGYGEQSGRLTATGDIIKVKGGNIGAYARLMSKDGLYANLLVKVDRYSVNYTFAAPATAPSFDGTTYGANFEVGAHLKSGAMFVEPSAAISATHSDLDGFSGAAGGLQAQFTNNDSAFGRLSLRGGLETKSANWMVRPYLGLAWEGELSSRGHAILTSGGTSLDFADASEGGYARIEAGVQGVNEAGLALFGKVEVVEGSHAKGVGGRVGLALRW